MHENFYTVEEIKVSSDGYFGIEFMFVFSVVGMCQISLGKSLGWYFFAGAIPFFVIGIIFASLLGPFNRAWFKFGILLGERIFPFSFF
jgi:hypothetical protein